MTYFYRAGGGGVGYQMSMNQSRISSKEVILTQKGAPKSHISIEERYNINLFRRFQWVYPSILRPPSPSIQPIPTNSLFVSRQNSPIISIDNEVNLSLWKELAGDLLLIGVKEMIRILCFVSLEIPIGPWTIYSNVVSTQLMIAVCKMYNCSERCSVIEILTWWRAQHSGWSKNSLMVVHEKLQSECPV